MIPLRTELGLKKFPIFTLLLCLVFLGVFFIPNLSEVSFFHFPTGIHLVSNIIYLWVFGAAVFERRGLVIPLLVGFLGAFLSGKTYFLLHPHAQFDLSLGEALVGVVLGIYMRREIWGNVETLVFGFKWFRVYLVPSYVHLFFWFFYLMVGNLFLTPPLSEAPMLYWIHVFSFLWGFLAESILGVMMKTHDDSTATTQP